MSEPLKGDIVVASREHADDIANFEAGQPVVILSSPVPWWRRAWRWVKRLLGWRERALVVTHVDRENGSITVEQR